MLVKKINKSLRRPAFLTVLLTFCTFVYLEIDHKVKPSEPYLLEYMNNFFSTLLVVPVCKFPLLLVFLALPSLFSEQFYSCVGLDVDRYVSHPEYMYL